MSISPIDNKLLPLGSLSQPFETREAVLEQPAEALETSRAPVDAQSLLAQDVWPEGPRLFNLPSLTNTATTESAATPGADDLERMATEVTSFLS
jgi:hypothetical protein